MLVERVTTLDIHTGELSQTPLPVRGKTPAFGYLFLQWQEQIGDDPRMNGEAWRILSKMMAHTAYATNKVQLRMADLVRLTRLSRQSITRAIQTLRVVGALTPSQAHGEYHLSVRLLYRGHLHVRAKLLRQQEGKP